MRPAWAAYGRWSSLRPCTGWSQVPQAASQEAAWGTQQQVSLVSEAPHSGSKVGYRTAGILGRSGLIRHPFRC